ncbi:ADP/ATP carrier receptor [Panus rudis PR-1116 ss-1]|nr:ADP/ATP carrier receptor [Panus rudis PR-1116 ss-1]
MSSSTTSPGVVDRVQNFVSENKKVVLVGAAIAVAAVGASVYFASTSRSAAGEGGAAGGDVEKGEKKKKKKSGKKKKAAKDSEPLLEEIAPKAEEEDVVLTEADIAKMSTEERAKAAASLKAKGNAAYQRRDFQKAAELYTRAIAVSPTPEPVFYSNRAACYVNMSPADYEKVIADCDQALALDKRYVKALNRRATALETLERYEEALRDFTAATIIEKFTNQAMANSVERVLKKLAQKKTNEIMATREPRLPSHTFVSAYFGAFRSRPIPELPETPSTGDETLVKALEALKAEDYIHSLTLVNEALEQGISFDAGKAEALNLRGSFRFLMNDIAGAKADLTSSVEILPALTQSWVKMASVHMEQGDPIKAFECFEEAIKQNPDDPDIYYHRGQVHFIMNEFGKAMEDYTKSTSLDENFVFSHIQLAVAQYKAGNVANSMATFRRTLKAFPDKSEPANYYGELLLDQQRYEDAVSKFERAIELEKAKKPPINVLPLVNKGLALFQWKQDISAAERCCEEALQIDPDCEAAVATLAQLNLQQSKIDKAVELFKRQAELSRSEPELLNALTYQYATSSQSEFLKTYPEMAAELSQIARGMM